jgi:protoheme ferro-lyase
MSTRHVILLTYGEPPTPAFVPQLKYSWRILLGLTRAVAPIPRALLPVIALSRARFRWSLWSRERYASPLEPITRQQAEGLATALVAEAPETNWRVHVAYEFRDPLLLEMIGRLPGNEPVDVLPMYVADSAFTHEIARRTLADWRRGAGASRAAPVRVLPPLEEGDFAALSARYVGRQVESRGIGGPDWALVMAAHGTLLEPKKPIETGRGATECVAAGIAQRLESRFGMVIKGWLNHVYGGRWTEPPIEEALKQVAEAGFKKLVYYPYGFSADNAESQLEGRIALRTQPQIEAVHLPCVNADAEFLQALARMVVKAAAGSREGDAAPAGAGVRRVAGT